MRKLADVTQFPDKGLPWKRRDFSGENPFLDFRLDKILSDLEKKVIRTKTRNLRAKDLMWLLFEMAHILPGESIRLGNFYNFWDLDVQGAKVAFGTWSKKKNCKNDKLTYFAELSMRNDWDSFELVYDDLFAVPLERIKSYVTCVLQTGSDSEKYALAAILENGVLDFDLLVESLYKFLPQIKGLKKNSAPIESLKQALSARVRVCIKKPITVAFEPQMAQIIQFKKRD